MNKMESPFSIFPLPLDLFRQYLPILEEKNMRILKARFWAYSLVTVVSAQTAAILPDPVDDFCSISGHASKFTHHPMPVEHKPTGIYSIKSRRLTLYYWGFNEIYKFVR